MSSYNVTHIHQATTTGYYNKHDSQRSSTNSVVYTFHKFHKLCFLSRITNKLDAIQRPFHIKWELHSRVEHHHCFILFSIIIRFMFIVQRRWLLLRLPSFLISCLTSCSTSFCASYSENSVVVVGRVADRLQSVYNPSTRSYSYTTQINEWCRCSSVYGHTSNCRCSCRRCVHEKWKSGFGVVATCAFVVTGPTCPTTLVLMPAPPAWHCRRGSCQPLAAGG